MSRWDDLQWFTTRLLSSQRPSCSALICFIKLFIRVIMFDENRNISNGEIFCSLAAV